eukprot:6205671-Pleurochrysis_carterae.AAC.2
MRADKDGDGKVTQKELVEAFSGMISTSEFFRKMARTLAVACVLLVICITAVIIASAVGFKDTTVNQQNIMVQYHGAAGNDDQPLSIGALEDVYRVSVAENTFARLREPLRNRPNLVVLDFDDGSFVQATRALSHILCSSCHRSCRNVRGVVNTNEYAMILFLHVSDPAPRHLHLKGSVGGGERVAQTTTRGMALLCHLPTWICFLTARFLRSGSSVPFSPLD